MKKIIVILFLIVESFSFSTFNDNLKLFNNKEIKILEQKIKKIEDDKKINIYINTLQLEESFTVSDPEKVLIFNLKKNEDDKKFEVELSFSKDMDIDELETDFDEILVENEKFLKNEEYFKYLTEILDATSIVLNDVKIETLNSMTMTKEQEENGNNFYLIGLIIIAIIVAVGIIFNKIRNLDEKDVN